MTMLTEHTTAREVIFDDRPDLATSVVAANVREHRTVRARLRSPDLLQSAEAAVTKSVDELLSMDLIDFAVLGWKRYRAVTDAARRTLDPPGSTQLVPLFDHHIDAIQKPTIEIVSNGRSLGTIVVELQIGFAFAGVHMIIDRGQLAGIGSGRCTVSGSLDIEGFDVGKRTRDFDIPGTLQLTQPIPLVRPRSSVRDH